MPPDDLPEFDPSKPSQAYTAPLPEFDPNKPSQPAALPQRGVFQRAGEEAQQTFESGLEAAKGLVRPLPKVEGEGPVGRAWRSAKTAAAGVMSPLTMTVGPVASAAESVLASGLGALTFADPAKQKLVTPGSEEAYEAARPYAGAALQAIRPATGPRVGPELPPLSRVERGAAEELERHATDLPKVQQRLAETEELVPGSAPTTFQASGDPGLGQLERTSRLRPESTAAFVERGAEQNAARIRALEGVEPGGAPADAASHLREAMRVEHAQAEQAVVAAQQRAWEASQRPGGTYDPTTYGNVFRQELQQAEAAARENERALWRKVDPNGMLRVNPQPMQELERGIYGPGNMTEAGTASLTPAETQISNLIQNYAPQGIPFRELTDLRSLTSSALRNELVNAGQTPAYARLSRLRQGIEDALERSVSVPVESGAEVNVGNLAAQRVREASAATAQRAQTFRPLRDVTRREGVAGPYRLGESQVAGRIVQPGAKGYDSVSNYLRAVGNERGLPDVQDAIAASMRREAIGADGVVSPRKLEGWMRRHQDALRAIDERDGGAFSQTLREAGGAQTALETAQAKQAEVAARYAKDELGKLIGTTDDAEVANIIGGMFGKADSVARVRDLMGKLTTPAAQAGARRAVLDYIQQRFLGTQQLGEDAILRGGRFVEFIRNNAAALRQALSLDQFNQLQGIAKDLLRTSQSATGKAIPGGSDTAQNMAGLLQRGFGTIGKAAIDTVMGHLPGGAFIVRGAEAGFGARAARRQARVQGLVDEAMLNPRTAQDLLRRSAAAKAGKPTPAFKRSRTGAALETGALSERERPKAKSRIPRQTGGYVPLAGLSGARPAGAEAPTQARELRTRPSQTLSHARAPRFQEGGEVSQYDTALKPGEEAAFQVWKKKYAPQDSGADYDLRGAWKAGLKPDPRSGHWPDTYKKPNHPTFSDQSQYAKDRPDLAGRWEGETYIPPGRQEGGDVGDPADAPRAQEPSEAQQAQDAAEAVAARVRQRYPVREPDPRALAASQGKVTWEQFLPSQERARAAAAALQRGEDYDPRDVFLGSIGLVGSPVAGLTREAATLGAGAVRRGAPAMFSPEGLAKQGPAYTKAMEEIMAEIRAGPKGAGPMDLSARPPMEVPQQPLPRYDPPRGVSARLTEAMANPEIERGIAESMEHGRLLGAHEWYDTSAIRNAFMEELGPAEGQKAFSRYMDMVAATSPRSDVPTNVRNASYYYMLDAQGRPLAPVNPYPYGHIAAKTMHRPAIEALRNVPHELSAGAPGVLGPSTAWDVFRNPKPASFSHNLQGNFTPVTVDTHAFRNIAMRTNDPRFLETSISQVYKPGKDPSADSLVQRYGEVRQRGDKTIATFRPQQLYKQGRLTLEDAPPLFWANQPNPNEYGAAERYYTDIAARLGLTPAAGQAAAWSGAGELTGLGSSPTHTFPQLMNERILFTARMRGENPNDTLRDFIRGRKPLLGLAGAAAVPYALEGEQRARGGLVA